MTLSNVYSIERSERCSAGVRTPMGGKRALCIGEIKAQKVPGEKEHLHTLHFTTNATYSHCMHLCNILFLIWISNYFPLVWETRSLDCCLKQEFCLYGQLKAVGIHLDQTGPSSQCIPPPLRDLKAALPRGAAMATRRLLSNSQTASALLASCWQKPGHGKGNSVQCWLKWWLIIYAFWYTG